MAKAGQLNQVWTGRDLINVLSKYLETSKKSADYLHNSSKRVIPLLDPVQIE
jgi:hypothetical protein